MAAVPVFEERIPLGEASRRISAYSSLDGFEFLEELEHLPCRSIEPNIFFTPRFLLPAMPRLSETRVHFLVVRDEAESWSRLRFLMPYTIERPAWPFSSPVIRAWSSDFGPQGTPLVDNDDPQGVIRDVLAALARRHPALPDLLMLPDIRTNGPFARILTAVAAEMDLTMETFARQARPFLESPMEGEAYLRQALGAHHRRDYGRLARRLADHGALTHSIARTPTDILHRLEDFLSLEARGWKGRKGTALAINRYQAAFAREAVNRLAEGDNVRIYTLDLDGRPIAALIVLIENGEAWTWKTAFDETYQAYSPGTLLMLDVIQNHLADTDISRTDSCAVPHHPVMSRLFQEREPVATLLVGLTPQTAASVKKTASKLRLHRQLRSRGRSIVNRLRKR